MEALSRARLEVRNKRRQRESVAKRGEMGAARMQQISTAKHSIDWLNKHRTKEGDRQTAEYTQAYRTYKVINEWRAWFRAGRFMSKKCLRITTETVEMLKRARYFCRLRQRCKNVRAMKHGIQQLYKAAGCKPGIGRMKMRTLKELEKTRMRADIKHDGGQEQLRRQKSKMK